MIGYLGVGSNLGDRRAYLAYGIGRLKASGLRLLALSSVWETEPVDCTEPLWFLNMAIKIDTSDSPLELLDSLQKIERSAGRIPCAANAPRTLDLDLLLLGDVEMRDPRLQLPHPRMWHRGFVLEPLMEVGPDLRNPATGRTVAEERSRLRSSERVHRIGPLAPARALPL